MQFGRTSTSQDSASPWHRNLCLPGPASLGFGLCGCLVGTTAQAVPLSGALPAFTRGAGPTQVLHTGPQPAEGPHTGRGPASPCSDGWVHAGGQRASRRACCVWHPCGPSRGWLWAGTGLSGNFSPPGRLALGSTAPRHLPHVPPEPCNGDTKGVCPLSSMSLRDIRTSPPLHAHRVPQKTGFPSLKVTERLLLLGLSVQGGRGGRRIGQVPGELTDLTRAPGSLDTRGERQACWAFSQRP